MISPSGQVVTLRSGPYVAEVVEVGGGIRSLTRDGDDVIAGWPADDMPRGARGQLLVPWPNRIEDGQYEFGGERLQLGLTEAGKRNAIHGLTRWVNWELVESEGDHAVWSYVLHPQPGYPFELSVAVSYVLGDGGLTVTVTAHNAGDRPCPYGVGAHPYLTVGRPLDECELTLPATTRCEVDARSLPSPPVDALGGPYDFTERRLVGPTVFDNPFSGVRYDDSGHATATLRDPATGRESALTFDASYRWLQVFSGDDHGARARESLAVEPMTCPPNAFRSGADLITLDPDSSHTATFTLH
jgi:aldose 1-epimerase